MQCEILDQNVSKNDISSGHLNKNLQLQIYLTNADIKKLEAQLESAYRFLVQPDPWLSVKLTATNQAGYVGLDTELLKQRKAFLRDCQCAYRVQSRPGGY